MVYLPHCSVVRSKRRAFLEPRKVSWLVLQWCWRCACIAVPLALHFSPSDTASAVSARLTVTNFAGTSCSYTHTSGTVSVRCKNTQKYPITVSVTTTGPKTSGKKAVGIGKTVLVHSFKPTGSWSYRYSWCSGSKAGYQKYGYRFPWKGRRKVTQGRKGPFSHNNPSNLYAYDIAMPIGTPIYAARAGVVIAVESKYRDNPAGYKPTSKDYPKANGVYVAHSDGTIAMYIHFTRTKPLRVKVGQKVKLRQILGYSGNSGYSTGPHLHFNVVKPQGNCKSWPSVPFHVGRFRKSGKWRKCIIKGTRPNDFYPHKSKSKCQKYP